VKEYLDLLAKVDAWYQGVQRSHPDKVTCTKGCRDCCLGLYDISIADRDLLREGLSKADPETRRDIESRAARIMADLREKFPDLEETLVISDAEPRRNARKKQTLKRGWGVAGATSASHAISVQPEKPIALKPGETIVVTIEQQSETAKATLNHFRDEFEAHIREGRCTLPAPWRAQQSVMAGAH
jgi:hypothetical protein